MNSSPNDEKQRPRLREFEYLRGLAIILVILGHSVGDAHSPVPSLLASLAVGWTIPFVFVSGFFFQMIYVPSFNYRQFIGKKIRNILLPFLIVTGGAMLLAAARASIPDPRQGVAALEAKLHFVATHGFLYGTHWYILFFLLLCGFAPVSRWFGRLNRRTMLAILAVTFAVSCLAHRPLGGVNALHSLVYFSSYYLFGMFFFLQREWLTSFRRPLIFGSLLVFVAALLIQSFVDRHPFIYEKRLFSFQGVDWNAVQKAALCLLLVFWCETLRAGALTRVLTVAADFSFGLYLLHEPLQEVVRRVVGHWEVTSNGGTVVHSLVDIGFFGLVGLLGGAAIVQACRAVFGPRISRRLVGA